MAKPILKLREVEANISDEARGVIAQLVLCWANFETSLTQFLLVAFGASLDEGSILVGTMDTRTKLDRLHLLYKHHGMTDAATNIRNLIALHKHFVGVRNAVAHSVCIGHFVERPDYLMFSAGRLDHGNKGLISGTGYSLNRMRQASDFALRAGGLLMERAGQLRRRRSKPPPEPPSFRIQSRPTPRKKGKGKQGRRPQGPQG